MKIFKMAVTINQQHHELKSFVRPPKCRLQSYSNFDQIMLDFAQSNLSHSFKHAFELTNLHRSSSTPCLSRTREDSDANSNPKVEIVGGHGAPKVLALVVEVAIAMASGFDIELVSSGLGGAYFVHARNGVTIAVVKPIDEEPLAFNNPKGFAGRMLGQPGLKHSIRVGETGIRELAAYLIDHDGFAGVPPTALVKTSHVRFHVNNSESAKTAPPCKIASLQRFVAHDSDAGDLGPSGFSASSVHRIGILDVRILNLDRHSGNMLVRHGQEGYAVGAAELVPIDHGLCLPETLDDPYFEWLHWPQASIPFSEVEVEYIYNLDPFKDAEILRTKIPSIRESSLRVLIICTIFLKCATAAGFCLADIGEMMTRELRGAQLLETTNRTGKPPKIPKNSSERLISKFHNLMLPLRDEECQGKRAEAYNNSLQDSSDRNSGLEIDPNAGGISSRTSFSVHNHNYNSEGISFGDMNKEEWELFLESFAELLHEALENRKNM